MKYIFAVIQLFIAFEFPPPASASFSKGPTWWFVHWCLTYKYRLRRRRKIMFLRASIGSLSPQWWVRHGRPGWPLLGPLSLLMAKMLPAKTFDSQHFHAKYLYVHNFSCKIFWWPKCFLQQPGLLGGESGFDKRWKLLQRIKMREGLKTSCPS